MSECILTFKVKSNHADLIRTSLKIGNICLVKKPSLFGHGYISLFVQILEVRSFIDEKGRYYLVTVNDLYGTNPETYNKLLKNEMGYFIIPKDMIEWGKIIEEDIPELKSRLELAMEH